MRQILMLAGGGIAALGALAVGVSALVAPADRFADCRTLTVTDDLGAPFTLTRSDGVRVTDTDVFAKPSLVYFGYSFCPDVCPIDNARNAQATDLLAEKGIDIQPVFITIDPERDTPDMLGPFVEAFHPQMVGLTGSLEEIEAVAAAYKAYSAKRGEEDDDEYYLMDHSTFSYLVLPEHGFVDLVRRNEPADAVAARTACFVANA
ncbi:MAG: SCO family protein [Paracoccaceae bacterium]|nr:SCO family protein [Paracoccaceae bacterium]